MYLKKLLLSPILLDASVLLVGIDKNDRNYSFERMKELYLAEIFRSFRNILIHETVFDELDEDRKDFINYFVGNNVEIVSEEGLYGRDPKYTEIFNEIASFDLFKYERLQKRDK